MKKIILNKATGATVQGIKASLLKNVEICYPKSITEQQRIVDILDIAFAAIEKSKSNAEQNIKRAKMLFDNYLQAAFEKKGDGLDIKKLSNVAEYFNGLTYSPKDLSNEGTIVLRSSNIQNDELNFSNIVRVTCSIKEKIIVRDGDILMCSRNGSKRLVGKTATIKELNEQMTFGTFMKLFHKKSVGWFSLLKKS